MLCVEKVIGYEEHVCFRRGLGVNFLIVPLEQAQDAATV
jgi:hypothetical protein